MVQTLLDIFFSFVFVYLAINCIYFFIIAIAGRIIKSPAYSVNPVKKRIAILIPAYKEDAIIVHTALEAKKHDYPAGKFDVFVAADHLKKETIASLKQLDINILEVQFDSGSKAKSLNKLLNWIPEKEFDVAVILDADNIMLAGCLEKINDAFQKGFKSVQAHRIAKNKNTPIAVLDAISEEINNHLFRRGQRALGFSANPIGSGMAFEFSRLKEIYNKPGILDNPACDREVDFEIMKAGILTEFVEDAYVLDEKVSTKAVFELQRTRWVESQIIHLILFFSETDVFVKNRDYYNKLFNNLIPPRSIILLVYFLFFLLYMIEYLTDSAFLFPDYSWWLTLTGIYLFTLLISVPLKMYSLRTGKALIFVPVLVISMVKAIIKMRTGRKEFLHTPKAYTQDS